MINLYSYQKEVLDRIIPGTILVGGVGSGKSIIGLAYFYKYICEGSFDDLIINKKVDLIIITTAKKRNSLEWEKDLAYFCLSTNKDISITNVTIDSWNNIKKYTNLKDCFFIFDEQKVSGYGVWAKSFIKITKNNKWILLTATPGDTWMDYIPVFIAHGFFKNKREFIDKHVIYDRFRKYVIKDYMGIASLHKYRESITINVNYRSLKKRKDILVYSNFDKEKYKKVFIERWNIYKDEPIMNITELLFTLRKVVYSDSSRIKIFEKIIKTLDKTIVFYNYNFEYELITSLLYKLKIPYSSYNHKYHNTPLNTNKWVYIVQYIAGAEAWNCITTNKIIFYSLNYSFKIMEQAKGRIDRLNSEYKQLDYYYLVSDSFIDKHILDIINKKAKFNNKIFIEEQTKNIC